ALPFAGTRHDCGSKLGMLQATVDQALQHGELKAAFKQWLIAKAASL
ncbi:MAG: UTP--glucose-1-phosphate uridylyltransferase, partial [Brachymonas sp.]|nr:UTP--glucose-1-phosphate uridylyltransferase [Brachymonas sp.]